MKKLCLFTILIFCLTGISAQLPSVLSCKTYGNPNGSQQQLDRIGYSLNGSPVEYNGCQVVPAIIVAVIDSFCNPWNTCDYNFGQYNNFTLFSGACVNGTGTGTCRNRPENYFIFHMNDAAQLTSMTNMLNTVPDNNYILAYTWYNFPYSTRPAFASAFQSLGATLITSLGDNIPYVFFLKKGDQTSLVELAGNSTSDSLTLIENISCQITSVTEIERGFMEIFSNPVSENLQFNVTEGDYNYWQIFNATGQSILSGAMNNENMSINVSELSNGLYILRVIDGKRGINRFFSKQ